MTSGPVIQLGQAKFRTAADSPKSEHFLSNQQRYLCMGRLLIKDIKEKV